MNIQNTAYGTQSVDDMSPSLDKLNLDVDYNVLLEDVEYNAIGSLLPDDEDELLAGIMDGLPNQVDDVEEYDLFGSGGGMELESDPQKSLSEVMLKMSLSVGGVGNGVAHYGFPNGVGTVAGEHPYGEHPSRTLFVRNINSNVEDSELITLFEVIEESVGSSLGFWLLQCPHSPFCTPFVFLLLRSFFCCSIFSLCLIKFNYARNSVLNGTKCRLGGSWPPGS